MGYFCYQPPAPEAFFSGQIKDKFTANSHAQDCPVVISSLGLRDPDLLKDILRSGARTTRHSLAPDLRLQSLFLGQHRPVRALVRLQPLEIVDLVPEVLVSLLSIGHLSLLARSLFPGSKVCTYIDLRQRREPHSKTVLNDRVTTRPQIEIHIPTLVDADLARRNDYDTVSHTRDKRRPAHPSSDDQALIDIIQRQARERLCCRVNERRNGHVDDAALQSREPAQCGGARCRGRQDDVQAFVVGDDDVAGGREGGLADS